MKKKRSKTNNEEIKYTPANNNNQHPHNTEKSVFSRPHARVSHFHLYKL